MSWLFSAVVFCAVVGADTDASADSINEAEKRRLHSFESVPSAALDKDDECVGGEEKCALDAIQIRTRRVLGGNVLIKIPPQPPPSEPPDADSTGRSTNVEVTRPGSGKPPRICDASLVAETCRNVNLLTPEFFGTEADANPHIVHAAELSEQLMISRKSITFFLRDYLNVTNLEVDGAALNHSAYAVSCENLCALTVGSFPPPDRPPTSDVACYVPDGNTEPACVVDVSPQSLGGMVFEDTDPDEASSKYSETPRWETELEAEHDDNQPQASQTLDTVAELKKLRDLQYPDKGGREIAVSVANLFRVYPFLGIQVLDLTEENAEPTESELQVETEEASHGSSGDEVHGKHGFDPTFYSSRRRSDYSSSRRRSDEFPTDPNYGLDTRRRYSTSSRRRSGELPTDPNYGIDTRRRYSDSRRRFFNYHSYMPRRRSSGDRRRPSAGIVGGAAVGGAAVGGAAVGGAAPLVGANAPSPAWKDQVHHVALKAQAYAAGALRNMNTGAAQQSVNKWFGSSDSQTLRNVRRVVNGVHGLLSNVDYVYPGSKCKSNVFAYVFPNPPNNKNSRGQYIFHLCDLYIKSKLQEQIETLTHEGSHHKTMSTDDVCIQKVGGSCSKRAYGRKTCAELARFSPTSSVKNADNYCFFINDAFEAKRGGAAEPFPAPTDAQAVSPAPLPAPRPATAGQSPPTVPPWLAPWVGGGGTPPTVPPWLAPYIPPQSAAGSQHPSQRPAGVPSTPSWIPGQPVVPSWMTPWLPPGTTGHGGGQPKVPSWTPPVPGSIPTTPWWR